MEQSNLWSSSETRSCDVLHVKIEGSSEGGLEVPLAIQATGEIHAVNGGNINGEAPFSNVEDEIPTVTLLMDVFINHTGNKKKNLAPPALNVIVKVNQRDMNSKYSPSNNVEEASQDEVHASKRGESEALHHLKILKAQRSKILGNFKEFGGGLYFSYKKNGVDPEEILDKLIQDPNANIDSTLDLGMERTSLHWAVMFDLPQIVSKIVETNKVDVNAITCIERQTALHYAVQVGNIDIVKELLRSKSIRMVEENSLGETPVQIAFQLGHKDIEKILLETNAVKAYVDALYRDRQVYVDAANAILVGAALIATVTFASWLQPPLGYIPYYGESYANSSPGSIISNPNYADVQHHKGLRAFWVFNSLAFYFSIGTSVFGARSVLPRRKTFIKRVVERTRINLWVTSILLTCSVFFVIIAFTVAGCIVLPPKLNYQAYMIGTSIIGGLLCLVSLVLLLDRILIERPRLTIGSINSYISNRYCCNS